MTKKKPIYQDICLLFPYGTFPGGELIHFIRSFGPSARKHLITDDCLIWNAVSGRGFIVWISEARPWTWDNECRWHIIVSRSGRNVHAIVLQHLIPYLAIQRWPEFKILAPETCSVFETATEFLVFAKRAILAQANLQELTKYGYVDEDSEVQLSTWP